MRTGAWLCLFRVAGVFALRAKQNPIHPNQIIGMLDGPTRTSLCKAPEDRTKKETDELDALFMFFSNHNTRAAVEAILCTAAPTPSPTLSKGGMQKHLCEEYFGTFKAPRDIKKAVVETCKSLIIMPNWAFAEGDPHLMNIAGEKFDVNKLGLMTLVQFPQGAESPGRSMFTIIADVQAAVKADPCDEKYIKSVLLSGTWLGNLQSISFHGHPWIKHNNKIGFRIQSGEWQGMGFLKGNLEAHKGAKSLKFAPGVFITPSYKDNGNLGAKVRIQKVQLNLQSRRYHFLDVHVNVPKSVSDATPMGGLLGNDPHDGLENLPEGCD